MTVKDLWEKFLATLGSWKVQLAGVTTFLLWKGKIDQYTWLGLVLSLTGMREYANMFFAKLAGAAPPVTVVNNSTGKFTGKEDG